MDLEATIKNLLVPGKGILAADESSKTADKRFSALGIDTTAENRRLYRQLLFTTPDVEKYLSGVILFEETINQSADDGTNFAALLSGKGIVPGIKTDQGLIDIESSPGEQISQGLEGLGQRNKEYFALGARFAKWRCVFKIGVGTPSDAAVTSNAEVLASYAARSQADGLVPIIEPEVLYEGTHSLEQSTDTIAKVLKRVFEVCAAQNVNLKNLILKTSMALPGKDSNQTARPEEVAQATLAALNMGVPNGVAGVVFLSGGQAPAQATANLNAIASAGKQPWFITFSYSRALQDPVLKYWAGKAENAASAQGIFANRAKLNGLAQMGKYSPDMEEPLG